jgi:hypothetical protein
MKIVVRTKGQCRDYTNGYWDRLDYAGNNAASAENIAAYVDGWNAACDAFPNCDYRKLDENGR